MPNAFFIRLTYSYEQIQKIISDWATHADSIVVYEHIGTKTEKIHCHVLIKGLALTTKRLRQIAQSYIKTIKGNQCMSCKTCSEDPDGTIKYMTKGIYDPKYYKGFEIEYLLNQKAQWVEPPGKISRIQKIYGNFAEDFQKYFSEWIVGAEKDPDWPLEGHKRKFTLLCDKAKTAAFKSNDNMWTQRTMCDYRTLVYTYTFQHNWTIPENTRFRKEMY